jgi:hypothetical protein
MNAEALDAIRAADVAAVHEAAVRSNAAAIQAAMRAAELQHEAMERTLFTEEQRFHNLRELYALGRITLDVFEVRVEVLLRAYWR